jgi:hypothetical protein
MDMNDTKRRNDPDSLTIEHGAKFYYLAAWRHPRTDSFALLWKAAVNARTAVANLLDRLDTIRANDRLSDRARADDEKAAAREALAELGTQQRMLNGQAERIGAERRKLAVVPQADAAQAVVDVALAAHFRSLSAAEREQMNAALVSGAEPRMVDAVLRLPATLFGLSQELRAVVESNAVARAKPEAVGELKQLGEAINTAQQVLNRCVSVVLEHSALTLEERMVGLGSGAWQPHVRDGNAAALGALARRYGVEAAAS